MPRNLIEYAEVLSRLANNATRALTFSDGPRSSLEAWSLPQFRDSGGGRRGNQAAIACWMAGPWVFLLGPPGASSKMGQSAVPC